MLNRIFLTVLSLSLSGSLLALAVLLLRPLLRGRVSRCWQYYIWGVVLLRLLLPFSLPESPVGALFARAEVSAAAQGEAPPAACGAAPAPPAAPASAGLPLGALWLGGAAALLLRRVAVYHAFLRGVRRSRRPVERPRTLRLYGEVRAALGVRRRAPLYLDPTIASPMQVGALRPMILLPEDDLPDEALRLILHHELTHLKRGDILVKWFSQLAVCLHWFNPLVRLAAREIERDCELACDEAVLRRLDRREAHRYGDTLLASVRAGAGCRCSPASVTLSGGMRLLEERLRAIVRYRPRARGAALLCAALTALLCAQAVLTGAYGPASPVPRPAAAVEGDARERRVQSVSLAGEGDLPVLSARTGMRFAAYGPFESAGGGEVRFSLHNMGEARLCVAVAGQGVTPDIGPIQNRMAAGASLEGSLPVPGNEAGEYYVFVGGDGVSGLSGTLTLA